MQAYSDPTREDNEHALPDIEVFYARPMVIECEACGNMVLPWDGVYENDHIECPRCGDVENVTGRFARSDTGNYWYWYCLPGCLADSDPIGPFQTESEALADAQGDN